MQHILDSTAHTPQDVRNNTSVKTNTGHGNLCISASFFTVPVSRELRAFAQKLLGAFAEECAGLMPKAIMAQAAKLSCKLQLRHCVLDSQNLRVVHCAFISYMSDHLEASEQEQNLPQKL